MNRPDFRRPFCAAKRGMRGGGSPLSFTDGIRDGIPIAAGYLSVSFGFGLMAVGRGLSALCAILISASNLTSAGQVAGVGVIASAGTLYEMALTQAVINLRYALMSITLTQKLDGSFTSPHRMLTAFGITDEVFAVASSKNCDIGVRYLYGLIMLPIIGWVLGTSLGALAGGFLPVSVKAALGLALYGMFIAIVVPPAIKSRGVLLAVLVSAAFSLCLRYIPLFSGVSQGFSVIACGVLASAAAAVFWPVKEENV